MKETDLDSPATKRDLKEVDDRLSGKVQDLSSKVDALSNTVHEINSTFTDRYELLRSEMNHGYRELVDRINDSETKLLKAFYAFAEGNNTRVQAFEESETATRRRLGSVETRLLEVERRLNIPPTA